MIEIVEFEDLKKNDVILIEGMNDGEVQVATILSLNKKEYIIVTLESGGLDYYPPDPDQIVRIGNVKTIRPMVTLGNPRSHALRYSTKWDELITGASELEEFGRHMMEVMNERMKEEFGLIEVDLKKEIKKYFKKKKTTEG